jgi:hypothetical protein
MLNYPCYMLEDGFLFRGLKLCVPKCSLRAHLLTKSHKLGHFGKDKSLGLLQVGPCEVLRKVNDNVYQVQLSPHLSISNTFNVQHLVPYLPTTSTIT